MTSDNFNYPNLTLNYLTLLHLPYSR